ncbi:helix-turn-helix transcriptional regulator [Streptomyces phaeoluteigriseus]|uniref:helix-turn-helix transcriptional regulator n=1 Tax=Streptomyces phaeoluteigriseus TaxID=114686 RepID=UPI0009A21E0A|nr:helix-turn-helix transcriptional regulator [Streptomyces phaeoluteigriseus]
MVHSVPAFPPDFVGRKEEQKLLQNIFSNGELNVILTGPTGIGKARLVIETLKGLGSAYRTVSVISEWGRHFPEKGGMAQVVQSSYAKNWLNAPLSSIPWLLKRREGSSKNTIVFLEGVNFLSDAEVSSLRGLTGQYGVKIVCTFHTDAPGGRLDSIWGNSRFSVVELDPLESEFCQQIAESTAGRRLNSVDLRRILSAAEGNPLLVQQMIVAALSEGMQWNPDSDTWSLPEKLPIPIRVKQLVERSLRGLAPEDRDLLEIIAVAGSMPLEMVAQLSTAVGLTRLEDMELIEASREAGEERRVQIKRRITRDFIMQSIPMLRRDAILKRAVRLYRGHFPLGDADLIALARWQIEVADALESSDVVDAACAAERIGDYAAASHFYATAVRRWPSPALIAAYAVSLVHVFRENEATGILDQARAMFGDSDPHLIAAWVHVHMLRGDLCTASKHINEELGEGYQSFRVNFFNSANLPRDAVAEYASIKDLVTEEDEGTRLGYCESLVSSGRSLDALTFFTEKLVKPTPASSPDKPSHKAFLSRAAIYAALGNLDEAVNLAGSAHRGAVERGFIYAEPAAALTLAPVLFEQGRVRDVLKLLRFHDSEGVSKRLLEHSQAWTTLAHATLGEQLRIEMTPPGMPEPSVYPMAAAWHSFLSGNLDKATDILVNAAEDACSRGAFADTAKIIHDLGRLGAPGLSKDFWEIPVQGEYLNARINYSKALANSDEKLLHDVTRVFRASNAFLFVSESYAELSRLYRRSEQSRVAANSAVQAKKFAAQCQGSQTPALLLIDAIEPLSARERQVVMLVAQGLSDREIADRLVISVRTAGNHLYRIYRKTGVCSRQELRQIAQLYGRQDASRG